MMKYRDILEMSRINFKRQLKKYVGLVIVFTMLVVVFNVIYSMTAALKENTSNNITNNDNLKIIEVSSVGEEISLDEFEEISNIEQVEIAFYSYGMSVALENDSLGVEANLIGMESYQASYLIGEKIELKDNQIILNDSLREKGVKIGDTVDISYNVRLMDGVGVREKSQFEVAGFYHQPVISSWYDNMFITTNKMAFEIMSKLYGITVEDIINSSVYKQSVVVFVKEIDYATTVAKIIEGKGHITSYALKSSQELPVLAKIIITVGTIIVAILILMSIIIMNTTLNSNVRGRYREIGILKSIGVNEYSIMRMLVCEIFLLWLVVTVISIICSVLAVTVFCDIVIPSGLMKVQLSFVQLVLSVVFTLFLMICVTWKTINSASKLNIVEVLRCE